MNNRAKELKYVLTDVFKAFDYANTKVGDSGFQNLLI
jgi:hypothetical protein